MSVISNNLQSIILHSLEETEKISTWFMSDCRLQHNMAICCCVCVR